MISSTAATEAGFLHNISLDYSSDAVHEVAYSPDGKRMVFGMSSRDVVVIDLPDENMYGITGEAIKTLRFEGHTDSVYAVKFSPDLSQVASGGRDNTIKIWDAVNGGLIMTFDQGHDVQSLSYNPNLLMGDRLASSGRYGYNILIWDTTKGTDENPVLTLEGHRGDVYQIRYSPDGQRIASGSADYSVRIWNAVNGRVIAKFTGHLGYILSVSYSPDGRRVASCSNDGTVRIWDTSDDVLPNDGTTLETMSAIAAFNVAPEIDRDIGCNRIEYSPDGSMIATDIDSDIIKIWDVEAIEKKQANTLLWGLDHVNCEDISFHPNGKAIALDSGANAQVWIFQPPPTKNPTKAPMKSPVPPPVPAPVPPPVPVPVPPPVPAPVPAPVSAPVPQPVTPSVSSPVNSPVASIGSQPSNNENKWIQEPSSSNNADSTLGAGVIAGVVVGSVVITVVLVIIWIAVRKGRKKSRE